LNKEAVEACHMQLKSWLQHEMFTCLDEWPPWEISSRSFCQLSR